MRSPIKCAEMTLRQTLPAQVAEGRCVQAYHPPPPRPPPPPPEPPENPDELDELRGIELAAALVALATAEEIERPKLPLDQSPPRRQREW